jgi:hypothetical protein
MYKRRSSNIYRSKELEPFYQECRDQYLLAATEEYDDLLSYDPEMSLKRDEANRRFHRNGCQLHQIHKLS